SLFPSVVAAAVPSLFYVNVSVPATKSIVSYSWNFGDNSTMNTTENYANHIYNAVGAYTLIIEATDNLGFKSSKSYTISVVSPKQNANATLTDYRRRLSNLTYQSFPAWYKPIVESKINADALTSELNSLERRFNAASSDSDYAAIMANLSNLKIPKQVKESSKGSSPFFIDYTKINLEKLKELGAGDYENEEETKKAVARWLEKNFDINL
ncbi:MAG: PKD domain-containing protein, partial [Nanoarchaeota archaeon]